MSIELLELAAAALGELLDEVVFVGGATVGLWISDPGAPAPRPTKDVDIIVQVTSRGRFHEFEERLRRHGLHEDADSRVICRWRYGELVLDVMPTDASILGFSNRWQALAVPHAIRRRLPSGAQIAAVSPPFLLATKLEAFAGRGRDDYMGSRDFADVISLLDGRSELVEEVQASPADLRTYLASEFTRHQAHPRFLDGVYGGLLPDDASQARAELMVAAGSCVDHRRRVAPPSFRTSPRGRCRRRASRRRAGRSSYRQPSADPRRSPHGRRRSPFRRRPAPRGRAAWPAGPVPAARRRPPASRRCRRAAARPRRRRG